jgi:hypothetical protein
MKIINEKPLIWASVRALLDFDENRTIFTYGDAIYNPAGFVITPDLIVHEMVHKKQQASMNLFGRWFGAARWWKRYLRDPKFRFEQELEAYRAQYQYVAKEYNDREKLSKYLMNMSRELVGPMYGNLGGNFTEVMSLIRQ